MANRVDKNCIARNGCVLWDHAGGRSHSLIQKEVDRIFNKKILSFLEIEMFDPGQR